MSKHDINKAYVSPYDKFLYQFNKSHALSASQQQEILKHTRIAELRDNPHPIQENKEIWEAF